MKLYPIRAQTKGDTRILTENFNAMVRVVNALQNLQFDPRYFDTQSDGSGSYVQMRDIPVVPTVEGGFSGVAYVSGHRTTGLNSDENKPWVKCDFSTGTATEETGPPSIPFPDIEEWYEKANTFGDIHVVRA